MAKRSSKKKEHDFSIIAHRVVQAATEEPVINEQGAFVVQNTEGKNPAAVELGRLGGKKGGKARAAKLTPEQRSEIARKAAQARWRKT